MKLSSHCMYCLVKRQEESISSCKDENLKSKYMKEVLKIISNAEDKDTAPVIIAKINELHKKFFKTTYSFKKLKKDYNELMLNQENNIWNIIKSKEDKLLCALKFARAGNYIDFGAMAEVDNEKLKYLMDTAEDEIIDLDEYIHFREDLVQGKTLIYLTDNCGEIVLDKLLIKIIKESYPHINIKVIVRGMEVLNDATLEDAKLVGLTDVVTVIDNGTEVAGTQLDSINSISRQAIDKADVIISKGQGNFETLHGCGLNIYYLFLCKCDWFVRRFNLEKFKGVFTNEKNLYI